MDGFVKAAWSYKAEGNKHVVVCDGKGSCLRLLKSNFQSRKCLKSTGSDIVDIDERDINNHNFENLDEIEFVRCVVLPLLNYCDACYVPKVVKLPAKFIKELDKQIIVDRPQHRVHQALNYAAPALLMQDYCFIPDSAQLSKLIEHGVEFDSDVFTVEIKLKNGLLKECSSVGGLAVCQFCKTQMYRVFKEKRYKACSFYCPLDLFSGNEKRMKKALCALFLNPQNNLRLFQNGDLLYSQEIFDMLFDYHPVKTKSFFSSAVLKDLFSHLFQPDCGVQPDDLVDILCKALLLPVAAESASSTSSAECSGAYFKNLLSETNCQDIVHSELSSEASLPSNSILGVIISQQKLDTSSWPDIYKKTQKLDSFLDKHPEFRAKLGVDAPYSSLGWEDFLLNPGKAEKNNQENEMRTISHQLRQFYVTKSFNDCSIMLSFQKLETIPKEWPTLLQDLQSEYAPSSRFNITRDFSGNYYVVSIAIVDTDPKYSSNMSLYHKKYSEISVWWKATIESLALRRSNDIISS